MEVEEAAFIDEFKVEEAKDGESSDLPLKEKILQKLDEVEAHVEELRRSASLLENKKDNILTTLQTLKTMKSLDDFDENDKDDILRYLDRIFRRCTTVDVSVLTTRTEDQVDALYQVNCLIDNLIIGMRKSPDTTRARCLSYVSACSSSYHETEVAIDKSFELAVLGCTLDDQKKIRQRLSGLLDYMTKEKWKQAIQPID